MTERPTLVAHRGYPTMYPENTLVGYRAAVKAGASWIETDIQITRDQAVVLYHDATLTRISGVEGSILERTLSELQDVYAAEETRFGSQFADEPIATLNQLADLIRQHPRLQAMIEIKQESIDAHGIDAVVALTHNELDSIKSQCVLISKNTDALSQARREHGYRIGWVLPAWTDAAHTLANELGPEFMICKVARFPDEDEQIWRGCWQWMIYSIDDPDEALRQPARGIDVVETNAIGEMLKDERLRS